MISPTIRDVREVVREEPVMRARILTVLADGPLTIPEIAAAIGAPAPHRTVFAGCAWTASAGTIAGHPARVTTRTDGKEQHA